MHLRCWVCFFRLPPLSDAYSGSQTHCEATHHGEDLRSGNSKGNLRWIRGLPDLARVGRKSAILADI